MLDTLRRGAVALVAIAVAALGAGSVASAATHKHKRHTKRHATKTASSRSSSSTTTAGSNGETELTGTTAQQAKDAALAAVPGGTVERASTERAGDPSGAAYEVHVRKSDGSEVEVLEDSSFKVIATNAHAEHGGPGGRQGGSNEDATHESGESADREAQENAGQQPAA